MPATNNQCICQFTKCSNLVGSIRRNQSMHLLIYWSAHWLLSPKNELSLECDLILTRLFQRQYNNGFQFIFRCYIFVDFCYKYKKNVPLKCISNASRECCSNAAEMLLGRFWSASQMLFTCVRYLWIPKSPRHLSPRKMLCVATNLYSNKTRVTISFRMHEKNVHLHPTNLSRYEYKMVFGFVISLFQFVKCLISWSTKNWLIINGVWFNQIQSYNLTIIL